MTRASLLTLAALAALASAAHAQTLSLHSGDAVTVDGTGTHGLYGGQPLNTATTSYTGFNIVTVVINGTAAFTLGAGGSLANTGLGGTALGTVGSGPVTITGGAITATGNAGIGMEAVTGTVTVFGGVFTASGTDGEALIAINTGTAVVAGGSFIAPGGRGLQASGGGTLSLFSLADTPFLVNNVPMNNTTLPAGSSGTISGTWLDGEPFNTTFYTGSGSTFNLNVGTAPVLPAPEPSACAALLVGALGVGALTLRARRRAA